MEWYEIFGTVILWFGVVIISIKVSEWRKKYFKNDNWKKRKK